MNTTWSTLQVRRKAALQVESLVFGRMRDRPQNERVKRVEHLLLLLIKAENLRVKIHDKAGEEIHKELCFADQLASLSQNVTYLGFGEPLLSALNDEYRRVQQELDCYLQAYKWTPTIIDDRYGGMRVVYRSTKQQWAVPFSEESEIQWEDDTVQFFLLQSQGNGNSPAEILRFRKCITCARWFYAPKKTQQHCRTACSRKQYSKKPAVMAKRNEKEREKRRQQREELSVFLSGNKKKATSKQSRGG
jgi:hypothetical protein